MDMRVNACAGRCHHCAAHIRAGDGVLTRPDPTRPWVLFCNCHAVPQPSAMCANCTVTVRADLLDRDGYCPSCAS